MSSAPALNKTALLALLAQIVAKAQLHAAGVRLVWRRLRPAVRYGCLAIVLLLCLLGVLALFKPAPSATPNTITVAIKPPQQIAIAPPPTTQPPTAPDATADLTAAANMLQTQLQGNQSTPETTNESSSAPAAGDEVAANDAAVNLAQQLLALQRTTVELPTAPITDLTVASVHGLLPRIAADGRTPWQAYARPAPALPSATTPKLAILLLDMGLSARQTGPALEQLPSLVTLSFNAYSPNLQEQINIARSRGHEVLLDIPMQPEFYPDDDPGPEALLVDLPAQENLRRLHKILARGAGAFGLTTSSGNGLLRNPTAMTPVLQDLARRGLSWIDLPLLEKTVSHDLAQQFGTVYLAGGVLLDPVLTTTALQQAAAQAVTAAQQNGRILLVARPYPLSLQTLTRLIESLPAAGVALVPVSALLQTKNQ